MSWFNHKPKKWPSTPQPEPDTPDTFWPPEN